VKKQLTPILLILLLLLCASGYGQITITTSNTPSICYNDGSLTVNASGGTAPYSYTITAGPSNPNITYPITLPTGQNTFNNLPHGTYTIVVTDGTGNTGTFNASVGGTYQFPSMTFDTTFIPGIICLASGGLPPYQYAVSSTGANTGFGPYQSSDTFAMLCPGRYWLRVRDSCQNIFTNLTTFSYQIYDTFGCINFSKGFMTVGGIEGHPPYTYSFMENSGTTINNNTGNFTGLPGYFSGTLTVTDSCGVQYEDYIEPNQVNLYENVILGQNYNIVVLSPACGGDTIPNYVSQQQPGFLIVGSKQLSCHSVQIFAIPYLDSVILRDQSGTIIGISHTGYFYDLSPGQYFATAFGGDSISNPCFIDSEARAIFIPYFPSYCESIMMNGGCQLQYELIFTNFPPVPDLFSLVYGPGDTVAGIVPSFVSNQFIYFTNTNPGSTYTMISDSGCSEQITLDSLPALTFSTISYLPCVGQPTIQTTFDLSGLWICNAFDVALYKNNNFVYDSILPQYQYLLTNLITFTVTDTGWYVVRLYPLSYDTAGNLLPYDTLCPIDTNLVYVSNSHIPYPYPNSGYVCDSNSTDTIYYHIYGGEIPYTIEIPGFDTVMLTSNAGVFPTTTPGQYTMIVYDNCGISRSLTFSVIDTCGGCPIGGIALSDTLFCAGDTVPLISSSIAAVGFQWLVNGSPYSISQDTFFIAPAGSYVIMLRLFGRSGCEDSSTAHISVDSPFSVGLGNDTIYCDTFSRVLNTGIPTTQWSTGQTGAQITVSAPGQYTATVSNKCGTQTSTININSYAITGFSLTADAISICDDKPDSVVLLASVDSLSQSPVTFIWSSGQTYAHVYSSTLTTDSAGSYQVTVQDSTCLLSKTISIAGMQCDSDSVCIHKIAIPDIFSPNGDGRNDTFNIPHTCPVYAFSMHIYDRWGQLVYESTDIDKGWDGNYRGRQEPEEKYLWFICVQETATTPNNCMAGTLTLLR